MKNNIKNFIKTESVFLSVSAVIVACIALFMRVAAIVQGQGRLSFDERLLLYFRNASDLADPLGSGFIENAMVDISSLGSFSVLMTVFTILLGYFILRRQYRLCFFIMISILGGSALSVWLKSIFMRPRPDLVEHLASAQLSSFPSGHSMSAAVVYLTLAVLMAETVSSLRVKLYILFWAVLVVLAIGISRVYIGVHWPSDVLAGWLGGIAWALFCWLIERSIRRYLMKKEL